VEAELESMAGLEVCTATLGVSFGDRVEAASAIWASMMVLILMRSQSRASSRAEKTMRFVEVLEKG
jgi:ABC-type transport system involved in Fe-S cluster assembly fused permease/ATPase subunit